MAKIKVKDKEKEINNIYALLVQKGMDQGLSRTDIFRDTVGELLGRLNRKEITEKEFNRIFASAACDFAEDALRLAQECKHVSEWKERMKNERKKKQPEKKES